MGDPGLSLYRRLLRWLPRAMRREYGAEMLDAFRRRRTAARRRGRTFAVVTTLRELLALATTAARARTGAAANRRPSRPLPAPRGGGTIDALLQDTRHAWRSLRRSGGFAAVAILTFAVGIGANTAIFSVVKGVLGDLPYPDADRLYEFYEDHEGDGTGRLYLAPAEYRALDESDLFEEVAAYEYSPGILTGDPHPERVPGARVSHDLLDVLQVSPARGRDFVADDERENVAIVGHGIWQRRWEGDPALVGSEVLLGDEPYTVIGVTGPEFGFFDDEAHVLTVTSVDPERAGNLSSHSMKVIGRLADGVSPEAVTERVEVLGRQVQASGDHDTDRPRTIYPISMYEERVGEVRAPLLVLLGAVGLLALIACSNVANLQVARGISRSREIAVRLALGADASRIARYLVTESILLALGGGVLGLGIAWASIGPLRSLVSDQLPRADEIAVDPGVLTFVLALTIVSGLLSSLAPGWLAFRRDLVAPLKEGSSTLTGGGGRRRLRAGLLVLQVSLALVLAVGSGLLVRSIIQLTDTDLGFEPDGVLTSTLQLRRGPSPQGEEPPHVARVDRLLERLESYPDVDRAAVTNMLPGRGGAITYEIMPEGRKEPVGVGLRSVSPGYFQTLGIPVVRGRAFADLGGRQETRNAVVVSETAARRLWPGERAIGRRLALSPGSRGEDPSWSTVVGVVGDVRGSLESAGQLDVVYAPYRRLPQRWLTLALRTAEDGPHDDLTERLRATVARIDPDQPISGLEPLSRLIAGTVARERLNALLLSTFAVLALALAAVGVYSVIRYFVTERVPEIGVRRALGARDADVVTMVLRQGLALTATGVVLGLAGAWGASRLLEGMLHQVPATDPITYALVALLLFGVAAVACLVPARRALGVDPIRTLRLE